MIINWQHTGNFIVTSDMVSNGKMIEEMIPREVTGYFSCPELELTSLEGSPKSVRGSFHCPDNNLTNLEGSPEYIGEYFYCYNNQLSSLEGISKDFSHLISVDEGLEIEKDYIESGQYKDNYWKDLLKYMISSHIDLTEITSWPKEFLNDELIKSAKGISKFQL